MAFRRGFKRGRGRSRGGFRGGRGRRVFSGRKRGFGRRGLRAGIRM